MRAVPALRCDWRLGMDRMLGPEQMRWLQYTCVEFNTRLSLGSWRHLPPPPRVGHTWQFPGVTTSTEGIMMIPMLDTKAGRSWTGEHLTRGQAASMLSISPAGVDKLLRAEMLPTPIPRDLVESWRGRTELVVKDGALTVLRADSITPATEDPERPYMGYATHMTDIEMTLASLRWWRTDPDTILDNELFVGTISTIPYALWRITKNVGTRGSGTYARHAFAGQLIARGYPNTHVPMTKDPDLIQAARMIFGSRIYTESGGPIAYLTPVVAR